MTYVTLNGKNFLRDFDSGKWCFLELVSLFFQMPVRLEFDPPLPANSVQAGVATSLLYSGSKFRGSQKSKGNCYDVEVILQVTAEYRSASVRHFFSGYANR